MAKSSDLGLLFLGLILFVAFVVVQFWYVLVVALTSYLIYRYLISRKNNSIPNEDKVSQEWTQRLYEQNFDLFTYPNYYEILGLDKTASQEEIKNRYRKLCIQFHPDRINTILADIMMKKINEAYGVLSDSQKRTEYDLLN